MKDKARYIIGGILCISGISSIINPETNYIAVSILLILFGISLMPFIYEKYLYKVNINKFHILLPILIFICICAVIPKEELNTQEVIKEKNTETIDTNKNTNEKEKEKNKTEKSEKNNKYDIEDTLTNIAQTYYENEARGNSTYFGKYVKVTATISSIDVDDSIFFNTGVSIYLKEKGAKYNMICQNDDGIAGITKYSRDEQITVIGKMNTMAGSSLLLEKCEIYE